MHRILCALPSFFPSEAPGKENTMNAHSLTSSPVGRWLVTLILAALCIVGPTASAAQSDSSARDAVLKAMRAQRDAKMYRVHMTLNNGTIQNVLEYVAPDRFHLTSSNGAETIIVGDKTYQRQKGGQWVPFPIDIGSIIAQFRDPKYLDQLAQGLTDVQQVGSDTLNGMKMIVYTFKTDQKAGDIQVTSTYKLWIGASDGLPYKQEVQSHIVEIASNAVNTIEYDPSIKIDPPL
jgi:hypothetical protein